MSVAVSTRPADALARRLSGQVVRIPNLNLVFASWPSGINEHLDRLRVAVDNMLQEQVKDKVQLQRLRKCDFGWFSSLWFPITHWNELLAITAFHVWIFVWDDWIDMAEINKGNTDTTEYRAKSLEYASRALGLTDEPGQLDATVESMKLFGDFAATYRTATDEIQRQRFYNVLEAYVNSVGHEQDQRKDGMIPSPEGYMEMRLSTSGVYTIAMFMDFTTRGRLPETLVNTDAIKQIWLETNILISFINDLFSLKKEVADGAMISLVPVHCHASPGKPLDAVIEELSRCLSDSARRFERAAEELIALASNSANVDDKRVVKECIRNFQTMVTGSMEWHVKSDRYLLGDCIQNDGSIVYTL